MILNKDIILLLVLNITLPTFDVYSDLYLIIRLFINGHPKYAGSLLTPFLLNYVLTWLLWWRMDKRKLLSWIPVLLCCYPQYCAAKVILLLWRDEERGLKKKRKLEREVTELEVFVEAVPTVLVLTFLWNWASDTHDERLLIIGDYSSIDEALFDIAYSSSIITASLGLAKVA